MGNDGLTLLQEVVCYCHAFVQEPAGVLAQIENQTLDVAFTKPGEGFFEFLGSVLVELVDIHIRDPRLNPHAIVNALARNLIADHVECQRLVQAFTGPDNLQVVDRLSVFLSFTSTMTSPGRMPALYAGEPLNGASTMVFPFRGCTVIPTP